MKIEEFKNKNKKIWTRQIWDRGGILTDEICIIKKVLFFFFCY
jgi:hypothetical protein